ASICIVGKDFKTEQKIETTLIRVENPYQAFSKLLELYNEVKFNKSGIENPSFISDSAKYGKDIYIGAFAYIGNNVEICDEVKIYPNDYIGDNLIIGNGTTVFAGAKIYSESIIGNHCTIHSGVIVGAAGFGFAPGSEGLKEI